MVNATVDNSPISITVNDGESTTVPSGEVWRVRITVSNGFGDENDRSSDYTAVYVNNSRFITITDRRNGEPDTYNVDTVLTSGDTVSIDSPFDRGMSMHIGGFVVSE